MNNKRMTPRISDDADNYTGMTPDATSVAMIKVRRITLLFIVAGLLLMSLPLKSAEIEAILLMSNGLRKIVKIPVLSYLMHHLPRSMRPNIYREQSALTFTAGTVSGRCRLLIWKRSTRHGESVQVKRS